MFLSNLNLRELQCDIHANTNFFRIFNMLRLTDSLRQRQHGKLLPLAAMSGKPAGAIARLELWRHLLYIKGISKKRDARVGQGCSTIFDHHK